MDNISLIIQLEDTPTPQQTSQFHSNPLWHQQQLIIPQDYQHYCHQLLSEPLEDHGINADQDRQALVGDKTREVRFRRSQSSSCIDFRSSKEDEDSSADHLQSCKRKKITHRDIERQRRQDMASLYSSLRSLLPIEYLKGKRAISDHIHEAVNYIKHMEEKIQKMSNKRNELKGLANSCLNSSMEAAAEGSEKDSLTVEPCYVGVEVAITTRTREFPLSRVLAILTQEGLNVVSCISTKVKERMLHSIESEVSDGGHIDVSEIEQKLKKSVRFAD